MSLLEVPDEGSLPEKPTRRVEKFNEVVVPEGWGMLYHGTNLSKKGWDNEADPFAAQNITLGRSLSVITERDGKMDDFRTIRSYSMSVKRPELSAEELARRNKPFEIRVLFYEEPKIIAGDLETFKTRNGYNLPDETLEKIQRYYFKNEQNGRHPFVPRGTTLIKLSQAQENGKNLLYYVPEDILADYLESSGIKDERLETIAAQYPEKKRREEEAKAQAEKERQDRHRQWELSITSEQREKVEQWNEVFKERVQQWSMNGREAARYIQLLLDMDIGNLETAADIERFTAGGVVLTSEQLQVLFENLKSDSPLFEAVWENNRQLPGVISPEEAVQKP